MRRSTLLFTAAVLFATASLSLAQSPTPAASPAASAAPTKGHRQKKTTPAPTAAPAATPAAAASPAMTPAAATSPAPVKKSRARKTADATAQETPTATVAPGGGPGMVWVNTKSHKYHAESSRYYGKTKEGKYLSEKDALAEGDKPVGNPKSDAPAKKP